MFSLALGLFIGSSITNAGDTVIQADEVHNSLKKSLVDVGIESDDLVLLVDPEKINSVINNVGIANDSEIKSPIVLVQKHQDVEPDKDIKDKGAIAKEANKIEKKRQIEEGSGDDLVDNNGVFVLEPSPSFNIEDLTSAKKERLMSGEFLLISVLVLLGWAITHVAASYHIYAVQMPLVCTGLGLLVGVAINVSNLSYFLDYLEFNDDIFFMMLLPPIIFESGFSLEIQGMHDNATPIFYFAFMGTFIAFVLSSLGFGLAFWMLPFSSDVQITLRGILSFGALISATDPVSVIALFKDVKVSSSLKAVVIGESLMNDAISISLYRTFSTTDNAGVVETILSFVCVFFGSVFVGTATGWITALVFKHGRSVNAEIKIATLVLMSYIAYLFAEFAGCSGIVAILFCGISQSMYTLPNLDEQAEKAFLTMIKTMSHLAESIAFIFLGMASCFLNVAFSDAFAAIFVTIIVVSFARLLAIQITGVCLSRLHGIVIPSNSVSGLTLCGLRGAVAFGLAKHARHDYGHGFGSIILAGTLAYSLFTVIMVGPTIPLALEHLGFASRSTETTAELYKTNNEESPVSAHKLLSLASPRATEYSEHRLVQILKFLDIKLARILLSDQAISRKSTELSRRTAPELRTPTPSVNEIMMA